MLYYAIGTDTPLLYSLYCFGVGGRAWGGNWLIGGIVEVLEGFGVSIDIRPPP